MTISNIQLLNQTIEIDNVASIVVTASVDDGTGTGTFVRAIRIVGASGAVILEVDVKSQTASNIELTTPVLTY